MVDHKDHYLSESIVDMCKILTTQYMKFYENRVEAERRMKELQRKGHIEEYNQLEGLRNDYAIFAAGFKHNAVEHLKPMPIWKYFLSQVTDLDEISALALIIGIQDISRFEVPSQLWAYCGMHTYMIDIKTQKRWFETKSIAVGFVDGFIKHKDQMHPSQLEKYREDLLTQCVWGEGCVPKKVAAKDGDGKLENWNKFLKKICFRISEDFDRGSEDGFYHQFQKKIEIREIKKMSSGDNQNIVNAILADPGMYKELSEKLPTGLVSKANSRARRETVRLFLTHLLQYWRQLRVLPVKKPRLAEGAKMVEFPGIALEFTRC